MRLSKIVFGIVTLLLIMGQDQTQAAPTDLAGSAAWTSLLKGTRFDYYADTQAQKAGTEIIGNTTHASMYFNYDDNGSPSDVADDILSLRIRIGDETKATHSSYLFVGVDADGDGHLDIFFSSGSGNTGIWDPGTGLNISPNTTSIANSASFTYVQGAGNYNFAAVSGTNDPDWDGNTDLDADSNPDVFVSFAVPIADVATQLATHSISFSTSTALRFISLSATQTNSLNSDFNGVDDGTLDDWSAIFQDLGLFTDGVTSTGVVDNTPPTTPTVNNQTTNDTTPVITGTFDATDADGGFQVTVNSVTYTLGDGNLSAVGNAWSLTIPPGDALGATTYEVTATATDAAANSASDSTSNELVIDILGPSAPTVASQATNDTTPLITGSYDATDAAGGFQVTVNGIVYTLGDGNLSASGNNWSLTIPPGAALSAATYNVTATAIDGAGNSTSDSTSNELLIDTMAPSAPTVVSQTTNDTTPLITGTYDAADAGGGLQVTVNGITYTLGDGNLSASGNTWSLTIPPGNALTAATYSVTATAIDGTGNSSSDSTSSELVLDTSAPSAPTVISQVTNDTTPLITGTYNAADAAGGFQVTVNGISYTLGDGNLSASGNNWSLYIPPGNALNSGTYHVVATATDGVGNSSSDNTSNELVIDTSPPGMPTVTSQYTDDTTPLITGTYDMADAAGGFQVTVNGIVYSLGDGNLSAIGNNWSLNIPLGNALPYGSYSVIASATDSAGNNINDSTDNELIVGIDSDGDGIIDVLDLDDDNDGILDSFEGNGGIDTDGDGIPDSLDLDSDNDGIPDVTEAGGTDGDGDGIIGTGSPTIDGNGVVSGGGLTPVDTDGDGVPDQQDLDADGDGIKDIVEAGGIDNDDDGRVDGFVDNDGDGFDDGLKVSPLPAPDSDMDGIPDFQDKNDTDNDGVPDDQDLDDDNDGIPDALEGDGNIDTDGDGIPDSRDLDSDNDGIFDLIESGATAPASLDSDNDGRIDPVYGTGTNGLADIVETAIDSGSLNHNNGAAEDSDGDGVPDFRDLDSDNDGITDVVESGGIDPDGDGIIGSGTPNVNQNGITSSTGSSIIDTDNDGLPDFQDLDSDNDGIFDLVEAGGNDADADGRVDGFTDENGDGLDDGIARAPLPLTDSNQDGVPDYLQSDGKSATPPIRTGLKGVGGCSVARGAPPLDPTLGLLCLISLLALNRKRILVAIRRKK